MQRARLCCEVRTRGGETESERDNWLCCESKQQQTVSIRSCCFITPSHKKTANSAKMPVRKGQE